jgi:Tfp pilus assembly protein PilF
MLRSRGDPEAAVRLFDRALEIDPNFISARLSRADVNIALGKYQAACRPGSTFNYNRS